MGFLQAVGDAPTQLIPVRQRQRPRLKPLAKRWAFDKVHGEKGPPRPLVHGEQIVAGDGVMGEMLDEARFLAEQRENLLPRRIHGKHHLDRDRIAGLDVVLTVGTAGGTLPNAELGDVMITRAVQFRCTQEFRNESFSNTLYVSKASIKRKHLSTARELMTAYAANLIEPDFGPPTEFYDLHGPNLPGHVNKPNILVEGTNFPKGLPMLTTDFFEFGTSTNGLEQLGCGVEMGDAVFGLVGEQLGALGPKWLVIRNASDPRINGNLPVGPPQALNMQAHWAVWFYEAYGYWTSVNSAIAAWSQIAA